MSRHPDEHGGPERVERLLHNMETYIARVPGFRRAHARGIGVRGHFTATPEAAALTSAEHMQGDRIEVVGRLSNSAGNPYNVDRGSAKTGIVMGMAVRFALPSGGNAEWAALSLIDFPARVPEDFIKLASAQRRGLPTGLPNPARIVTFLATHPHCLRGFRDIVAAPAPRSFATAAYRGLHAYYLVDAEGNRRAFRYHWEPAAPHDPITPEEHRELPPFHLLSEIRGRLAREPAEWTLVFELAEPGDPVDDLTKHWPKDRRRVRAGTLVLDRIHEDQQAVDDSMFDPTLVPPGIELSDDPVLHFRSEAYVESQRRRNGETKPSIVLE
ncbi:MAG: catalase family peroxidase [Solirubrobacteraceae bacterium]|nr:catalase family peroxidase [Solirubrobacteraceae bacterium]